MLCYIALRVFMYIVHIHYIHVVYPDHTPQRKGLVAFATSWDSLKLIAFQFENSNLPIRFAEACTCVGTAKFLSNFTYSPIKRPPIGCGLYCLCTVITSVRFEILFLILCTIPAEKWQKQPDPFRVGSGPGTRLLHVIKTQSEGSTMFHHRAL